MPGVRAWLLARVEELERDRVECLELFAMGAEIMTADGAKIERLREALREALDEWEAWVHVNARANRTMRELLSLAFGIQITEPLEKPLEVCLVGDEFGENGVDATLSADGRSLVAYPKAYVETVSCTVSFSSAPDGHLPEVAPELPAGEGAAADTDDE
jgi:hypothetical protein